MHRRRALFVFASVTVGVAGVAALACTDPTYLFLGRRYAVERDCLETTVAMDVLEGADPGSCETRCVSAFGAPDAAPALYVDVGDAGDGGRDLYVTVMCPPLPIDVRAVPTDQPVCVRALAALARKNTCLADGGATAPLDAATD